MIKVGIIGCGKIVEVRHAPEYQENDNCQISGFYDIVPDKAKSMVDQYGGRVYNSIEELLAADIDAVSVCVANHAHLAVSVQAFEAGKHVLCEKPMAVTPEGCRDMVRAAKAAGKHLMIGLNQRYIKTHIEAKALLESGEIGKLITFETKFCHPGPESWTGKKDSWFFDKRLASFGVMADLGVHKTDLLYYLTGKRIVETTAVLATLDKKHADGTPIEVDDNTFCIYKLENNVIGTMHVGWTNYGSEENGTRLYGTDGVMRIYDDPEYSLIIDKKNGERKTFAVEELISNEKQTSGHRTNTGIINAFVEGILTGKEPEANGESAMHAMMVIFANEKSAQEHRTVTVQQ